MIFSQRSDSAYETFLRHSSGVKIIQLHPQSRLRSLVLARLLCDEGARAFYYALDIDDINLRSFLTGVMDCLARQHPTFGRQLNIMPAAVLEEPFKHMSQILPVFIAELTELADGEFWLVLDEFDRADLADDVLRFVERLSHHAPERCKILLNGRTLPRLPWLSMIAKRHALILRDSHIERSDIYSNRSDDGASIKALSLGSGFVFLDDYLVDNWEGNLPRLLLFFALDRPEVTRNQICATFWPKLHIDQAVNVFHVTKRRLHKAVGTDVLAHDGRYYRINRNPPVYYDVFEFVEALLDGRYSEPEDPFEFWQRAAKLYRGPFLQGHDDNWILERRDAYQLAYIEALENIAGNMGSARNLRIGAAHADARDRDGRHPRRHSYQAAENVRSPGPTGGGGRAFPRVAAPGEIGKAPAERGNPPAFR